MSDPASDQARVGVALLNWNGGEFTIPCVESLLASDLPPWRVVVVDNASTDGSPDVIAVRFPEILLIRNERNLGFAAGTNAAIRALLAAGADPIWILNNDTVVHPACLWELTRELDRDPGVAAVTAKIYRQEPSDVFWYAGGDWSRWSFAAEHRGEGERDHGQYDVAEDVDFMSGCCILARAATLREVGLLDERYFAYYEDGDWCLRALKKRRRLRYIPKAVLWHKGSASVRKNTLGQSVGFASPFALHLETRNRIWVIRDHAGRPMPYLTALAALAYRCLYLSAAFAVLRRFEKLRAVWRGVRDGFGPRSKPTYSL